MTRDLTPGLTCDLTRDLTRYLSWLWDARAASRLQPVLAPIFVLCALPLMIYLAVKVPPGQAPDETAHAIRAASLLQGQFAGFRGAPEWNAGHWEPTARVMADLAPALVSVSAPDIHHPFRAPARQRLHRIKWQRAIPVPVPNTAVYPPFLYGPAAIGIGLAHAAGGDPFDGFRAARVCDAVAYALCGALALMLARRGSALLLAYLLLPSALWLGGMLHPDGQMVALTALSAACATRAAPDRRPWLWLSALALAPVIMARPPLFPLAGLIALPLGWRRAWAPMLAAVLPGLLWTVLVVARVSVPFYSASTAPGGPLWDGDPARLFDSSDAGVQIHILLRHPGLLLALPLSTMQQDFRFHVSEFLGVVGNLNLDLPHFLHGMAAAALLAALLGMGSGARNPRLAIAAVLAFVTILLIYDTEYISWTHPGLDHIDGVQGRYLLELTPLFLFAAPRRASPVIATLPAIALGIANLIVIPATVLAAYYR